MNRVISNLRIAATRALKRALSGIQFRGKGRILMTLCPRDQVVPIELHGFRFRCNLFDFIHRTIFLWDYDPHAVAYIRRHLRPGDTFVDVGANCGFYTLLASRIVGPAGRVIAIEPNPGPFAHLSATIAENGIQNITALNLALGEAAAAALELYIDPTGENNTASMVPGASDEAIKVPVVSLDSILEKYQVAHVNYLKIDVDGFERKVFAGASGMFAQRKLRFLQCEFSDGWQRRVGSSPAQLHAFILAQGFRDADGEPDFPAGSITDRFFEQADSVHP